MRLIEYQTLAKSTAKYPKSEGVLYCALGLCGESGEVADKLKRVYRDHGGDLESQRVEIARELGDVLWYVATLADELGFDLEEIADMNLDKLKSRLARDVITGQGDNR